MSRIIKYKRRKPMAEINIVPYVDVMLVLLIIFMITAPLLTQGVELNLPSATANALPERTKAPIVVSVDKQGKYYLNIAQYPDKPITAEQLMVRIAAELKRSPQRPVMMRGDTQANYGNVVASMVILQQAGVENIGLVTDSTEGTQS